MLRKLSFVAIVVMAAMLAAAGCGTEKSSKTTKKTTKTDPKKGTPQGVVVDVTLTDTSVKPAIPALLHGATVFRVANKGTAAHEFKVVRAPDGGALSMQGNRADAPEALATIAQIKPGATQQVTTTLKKGTYILFCNIPGHYAMGMHTTFKAV